ncbi:MAG: hypothetical protein PHP57_10345 [Sideroxydans sp.]|nr:hypothetical protein [Sideroxydans sp.]
MLPLEPTDDLAQPAFKDVASCTRWLSQLQLTNLNLAQATLRKQLDEFNRFAMRTSDRLPTLDVLRETIESVQYDFSKKLIGKKLPLSSDEMGLLVALSGLWQSLINGYLRCIQGTPTKDADMLAALYQRCLHYSGAQIDSFLRAGYEPVPQLWQQAHALYAHAEELSIHALPISDAGFQSGRPVAPRTFYATSLLMHRARLLGLSRAQWEITTRWLSRWGDSFVFEPRCISSKNDAPPLEVNLAGSFGLRTPRQPRAGDNLRYLAMVPLSKHIRVKTILLQQGQTPAQVDLGDELSSKECIALLNKLYLCWCEARPEPLAESPRETAKVNLCSGMENIYAVIAHKTFKPLKEVSRVNQDKQRQIETFGRVLDTTGQHALETLGFVPEEWMIEEDNLLRGQLVRSTVVGNRLGISQLVVVFAPDTKNYKLGVTHLVRVTQHDTLFCITQYMPGAPEAVVVRGKEVGGLIQAGSVPALLLPALEKLNIPASIVLPRDWFQAGRVIDITCADQSNLKITLGFCVEKGIDFERVSFKAG